jgi:hypothetical protein
MVFCIGLALISTAMIAHSVAILRLSRADLTRKQIEYDLAGAHLTAAAILIRSGPGGPFRWSFGSDSGFINAVAEPEAPKIKPVAAGGLSDGVFERFAVADTEDLKARLEASADAVDVDVASLDASPAWRACAPAMISSYGAGSHFTYAASREPTTVSETPAWRVGQLWRIALTSATGWRDERVVRFTGDAHHPVAVVARRLSRSDKGDGQCDEILAAAGA